VVSARPAVTDQPSAHPSTTSTSSNRRGCHAFYARGHPALSRVSDAADNGAASPSANPCRDNWGSRSPTARLRRVKSGSTRLTTRSASPRTRGRRTVIVPAVQRSRRGFP
jgi:hypothetical protein